jgi:hypothetical protein
MVTYHLHRQKAARAEENRQQSATTRLHGNMRDAVSDSKRQIAVVVHPFVDVINDAGKMARLSLCREADKGRQVVTGVLAGSIRVLPSFMKNRMAKKQGAQANPTNQETH